MSLELRRFLVAALMLSGIVLGVLLPRLSAAFEPLLLPALFLIVTFSLCLVATQPLGRLLRLRRTGARLLIWQLVVLPAAAWLVGLALGLSATLQMMLLLTASAGSLFASPAIANLLGLETWLSAKIMVLSTLLMPVSLIVFWTLSHGGVELLWLERYAGRVLIFLVLPILIAGAYRRYALQLDSGLRQRVEAKFGLAALLSLLAFGLGIMSGVAEALEADPAKLLSYLAVAIGFGLSALLVTSLAAWREGAQVALTFGMLNAYRNVGLSYAVVGFVAEQEIALYLAMSQLPVFATPLVISSARLLAQVFRSRPVAPLGYAPAAEPASGLAGGKHAGD